MSAYRKIRAYEFSKKKKISRNHSASRSGLDLSRYIHKAILVGAPLLVMAGFWLSGYIRNGEYPIAAISHAKGTAENQQTPPPRTTWNGLQPRQIADNFLGATTHEERLKWVRHTPDVSDIVTNYYDHGPGSLEKVSRIRNMDDIETEEGLLARFMVEMKDGRERMLFVPYSESGGSGVDFKSYSVYCSQKWQEMLDGKVSKADEMRVNLQPSDYYNFDFRDEGVWRSFVATSPDLDGYIHLYARQDDPALSALLTYPFPSALRFTISIEKINGSNQNRQWKLSRVLFPGWVESGPLQASIN